MDAMSNYNRNELNAIRDPLIAERMKMDKSFSLFLDKFHKDMCKEPKNEIIWNQYNKRYEDYTNLKHSIEVIDYYIKKCN